MPGYELDQHGTLKNKLGATSHDELTRLEANLVASRMTEIRMGLGPKGKFDADHLKAFHRHIFQDVFEWAGHTRDERFRLADGTTATEPVLQKADGKPFLKGPQIPAALDEVSRHLREADYLRGLPREQFAEQAADIMIELNRAHPFREGNGRTQRIFMRELAKEAGHDLDFRVISGERMIQASIAANEQGDPAMMRRMFDEISNPARVALLGEGIEKLQAAYDKAAADKSERATFNWNNRYIATVTPGVDTRLTLAGVAGDQFMARTDDAILFGKAADLPQPPPAQGASFQFKGSAWSQEKAAPAPNPAAQAEKQRRELAARLATMYPDDPPEQTAQRERDDKTRDDHER
jgi:cell filamentation protein